MSRKGPRETKNVSMTAFARERKRPGRRVYDGDKQYDRRRYMKYAGWKPIRVSKTRSQLVQIRTAIYR